MHSVLAAQPAIPLFALGVVRARFGPVAECVIPAVPVERVARLLTFAVCTAFFARPRHRQILPRGAGPGPFGPLLIGDLRRPVHVVVLAPRITGCSPDQERQSAFGGDEGVLMFRELVWDFEVFLDADGCGGF